MANTLAALVGQLRGVLLDEAVPYQWPDSALQLAVQEAVAQHSYLFPQRLTVLLTVGAGQQVINIYAQDWLASGGPAAPGTAPDNADLIGIARVELPAGTALPEDVAHLVDPTRSGSTVYRQAWRWSGGAELHLRNPASGAEVGANVLRVELLQTYSQPDVAGLYAWNGPANDLPLVQLLAQRAAYQQLAGWQVRDGVSPQIDAARQVAGLEVAVARAIKVRRGRAVRSRPLDLS